MCGTGSVYVFTMYGDGMWSENQKLLALDGAAGDQFGWSMAVYGSIVAVGAYTDNNERGNDAGQSGPIYK